MAVFPLHGRDTPGPGPAAPRLPDAAGPAPHPINTEFDHFIPKLDQIAQARRVSRRATPGPTQSIWPGPSYFKSRRRNHPAVTVTSLAR